MANKPKTTAILSILFVIFSVLVVPLFLANWEYDSTGVSFNTQPNFTNGNGYRVDAFKDSLTVNNYFPFEAKEVQLSFYKINTFPNGTQKTSLVRSLSYENISLQQLSYIITYSNGTTTTSNFFNSP